MELRQRRRSIQQKSTLSLPNLPSLPNLLNLPSLLSLLSPNPSLNKSQRKKEIRRNNLLLN